MEPTHSFGPVRFISLNVRYATKTLVPGEEPWSVRCPKLCAQLKFITMGNSNVFICLQEVLHTQLVDIQAYLGPSWSHIGHGRDDGQQAGEFSPIFYQAKHWRCERDKTYWLSPTPDVPSVGWDAALKRVVTVGSFHHKISGTIVIGMSTHLDHRGEVAREESAKLLLKLAREWGKNDSGDEQNFLMLGGDMNSTPSEGAYKVLTAPGSGVDDISTVVPEELKYGNRDVTYTSFGEPDEEPKTIDFLFAKQSNTLRFLTFGILPNQFDDKVYLSDHRPVVADIEVIMTPTGLN